jgi:micrococcal nuclease
MENREYPAQLIEVVDGDTMDLRVDLGFRTYKKIRVRIRGIDTREVYGVSDDTRSYEIGKEQSLFAKEFLENNGGRWPLTLQTYEEEKGAYGRWIGDILVDDDSYAEAVLAEWPEAEYE